MLNIFSEAQMVEFSDSEAVIFPLNNAAAVILIFFFVNIPILFCHSFNKYLVTLLCVGYSASF